MKKIIVALLLVCTMLAPQKVMATSRTITLYKDANGFYMVDDNTVPGAATATAKQSQNGANKITLGGGEPGWGNGSGSTYFWTYIVFSSGYDTIQLTDTSGAINNFVVDSSASAYFAADVLGKAFRPKTLQCGGSETHLTSISSLSGTSAPYSGHLSKVYRYKAPFDFSCYISFNGFVTSGTIYLASNSDSIGTQIPGFMVLTGLTSSYTCVQSVGHTNFNCQILVPPDASIQLNLYYLSPTKPNASDAYFYLMEANAGNNAPSHTLYNSGTLSLH